MALNRFYPLYLLMNLYNETRQVQKTIETAKSILNKEIKIPLAAVDGMTIWYGMEIICNTSGGSHCDPFIGCSMGSC